MAAGPELPSGTVTFLFTDIEGSTALLKRLGDGYAAVLDDHRRLLRAAFAGQGGREIDTQGDSFFYAFPRAKAAIRAAIHAQQALLSQSWPEGVELRVRMGLHSGEPLVGDDRYVGIGVNRAARIGAASHGGQVLISDATRALVEDDLPEGVFLRDLGLWRLKDIDRPERISQIVAEGLPVEFPPLRAHRTRRRLPSSRRGRLVLVAAALVLVGAAAAGVLLTSGSASSAPVRFRANSLAAVDPKTGRPVADISLGFAPTGVVAGGDKVWVLDAPDRTVTAIDPKSLHAGRSIPLQGDPTSQWAAGATDWVALSGAVEMVEASGDSSKIALWRPPANVNGPGPCLSAVTGSGRRVWVSQGRKLAELDAATGSLVRPPLTLPPAPGLGASACYGVQYANGRLLAVRDADESAGLLDPSTGAYTSIVSGYAGLAPEQCCWTVGLGSLWLGTQRVDPTTAGPAGSISRFNFQGAQIIAVPIGAGGGALVVDPASGVWALAIADRKIVQVDPAASHGVPYGFPLYHFPSRDPQGVAAGHGRIWVALQSP